jgi:hypothetical protein
MVQDGIQVCTLVNTVKKLRVSYKVRGVGFLD